MLFTFWTGPLTWVERLCFVSAITTGHKLTVYSYQPLSGLPAGVANGDANDVIPFDRFFLHRTGSSAMFSDLFRYEGLRRSLGTWVDADMLMLRPLADLGEVILGWTPRPEVNNAVIRLPPDHPFLASMKRLAEARVPVAAHWPLKTKVRQIMRTCIGLQKPISQCPLLTFGPPAITHFVRCRGLEHQVLPAEVLFPVPGSEAPIAFDPQEKVERFFTQNTRAVHLCNSKISHLKRYPPPPGSFLARMCEKNGINTAGLNHAA